MMDIKSGRSSDCDFLWQCYILLQYYKKEVPDCPVALAEFLMQFMQNSIVVSYKYRIFSVCIKNT